VYFVLKLQYVALNTNTYHGYRLWEQHEEEYVLDRAQPRRHDA